MREPRDLRAGDRITVNDVAGTVCAPPMGTRRRHVTVILDGAAESTIVRTETCTLTTEG